MSAKRDKIQPIAHGDIAAVTFWDHVQGGGLPILFTVYGIVTGMTKEHIELTSWGYADKAWRGDDNETRFSIVRRAITEQRKLK